MKTHLTIVSILASFLCLFLVLAGLCFGEELIAPSRKLTEGGQAWGRLAVFSEPPELEVFLNGENVGRTPLWLEKVKPGFYMLKVGGEPTGITVNRDRSTKIGLFRGSFVSFPEDEKETAQHTTDAIVPDHAKKMEPGQKERRAKDLTMWEVLIGGSSIRLWEK